MVKRKLLNRSKRPPTDGWRLNDEEVDKVNKTYKFTLEGCCDRLGFNDLRTLPFYAENHYLIDHDVSKQLICCSGVALRCLRLLNV